MFSGAKVARRNLLLLALLATSGCRPSSLPGTASANESPTRTPTVSHELQANSVLLLRRGSELIRPWDPRARIDAQGNVYVANMAWGFTSEAASWTDHTLHFEMAIVLHGENAVAVSTRHRTTGDLGGGPRLELLAASGEVCAAHGDGRGIRFLRMRPDLDVTEQARFAPRRAVGRSVPLGGAVIVEQRSGRVRLFAEEQGDPFMVVELAPGSEDDEDGVGAQATVEGVRLADGALSPDGEVLLACTYRATRTGDSQIRILKVQDNGRLVIFGDALDEDRPVVREAWLLYDSVNRRGFPSSGGPEMAVCEEAIFVSWIGSRSDGRRAVVVRGLRRGTESWSPSVELEVADVNLVASPLVRRCGQSCAFAAWICRGATGRWIMRARHLRFEGPALEADSCQDLAAFGLPYWPGHAFGFHVEGGEFVVAVACEVEDMFGVWCWRGIVRQAR